MYISETPSAGLGNIFPVVLYPFAVDQVLLSRLIHRSNGNLMTICTGRVAGDSEFDSTIDFVTQHFVEVHPAVHDNSIDIDNKLPDPDAGDCCRPQRNHFSHSQSTALFEF